MAKLTPESTFRAELWRDIRPSVLALPGDVALFFLWLAALTLVFVGLRGLSALGYRSERVELLETLHYYAYLPVFAMFLVDLIWKVLAGLLWRKKAGAP
jgi:hypothetical protein